VKNIIVREFVTSFAIAKIFAKNLVMLKGKAFGTTRNHPRLKALV
jgi:hypothetical protein